MELSERGRELIQGFEACRLHAYKPTPEDVWTIGWGATGMNITHDTVWTQEHADARFLADTADFARKVWADVWQASTTQGQFDAMVSLAYNIGLENFARSTVLRKHRVHDYAAAADGFLLWNKQKGKVLNGLVRRRKAERQLYLS